MELEGSYNCSIGKILKENCNSEIYTKLRKLHSLSSLDENDKLLLSLRITNFNATDDATICEHHLCSYLRYFETKSKKCCDPFFKHKSVITSNLRILTLEKCIDLHNAIGIQVVPGYKVCCNCMNTILSHIESKNDNEDVSNNSNYESNPTCSFSSTEYKSHSQNVEMLDELLDVFDIPPLKKQKMNISKLENEFGSIIQELITKTVSKMNNTCESTVVNPINLKQLQKDSDSVKAIINNILSKYNNESLIKEKIQLLTLLPNNWSYNETYTYFKCTRYMFEKAKKLRAEKGVLANYEHKVHVYHSDELKNAIIEYYNDDANSRMCSGMKECLSIPTADNQGRHLVQKRLLLYDLRDLYTNWIKLCNKDRVPSFSLFASLKPKECVLAGAPGTHSICVCSQHQNVKLKLNALCSSASYRDLINQCVCSIEIESCMLHECSKCPGKERILSYIKDNFLVEKKVIINYNKWTVTKSKKLDAESLVSRANLGNYTEPIEEFLQNLVNDVWDLTEHHFVAESQKYYMSHCKNTLQTDTCLAIMDFAENYTFISQDSIQAFYFSSTQATLHPIVIYYKNTTDTNLKIMSFCIISDCLKHTACSVNVFQEKTLKTFKEICPWVGNIIYFSDGAPTQYKNKNHFTNLNHHKCEFDMNIISYNFFATSHGKSSCDGIGAVAKRTVRKASLQNKANQQILSPKEMFKYLNENEKSIKFIWVSKEEVETRMRQLKTRFAAAKTIPNTRKYHSFIPLDQSTMKIKITSFSSESKEIKIQ